MDAAFQNFENLFLSVKRYPQFFDGTHDKFDKIMELYHLGYCYPLPERDGEGRRVVFSKYDLIDVDRFTVYDAVKLVCFVIGVLLEEEETQIAGFVFINDCENVSFKQLFSPMDAKAFLDFDRNSSLCRQKGNHLIKLPPVANILIDLMKSLLSDKLKSRLLLHDSFDGLKDYIDMKILPKEYGGTISRDKMVKDFYKVIMDRKEIVMKCYESGINWDFVPAEKISSQFNDEAVGSFRKLEID
jgi:hypothetical protein